VYAAPQALGIHNRMKHGVVGKSHHSTKPRSRTGTQQEKCPECGISYQAKYLYYSHLPKMHGIKMASPSQALVPIQSAVNHVAMEQEFTVTEMLVLRRKNGKLYLCEEIK
jgi:uncharacterized C2H2 Zn-finger protein